MKETIRRKNTALEKWFSSYLLDNPEIAEQIPKRSALALMPADDPTLAMHNLAAAMRMVDMDSRLKLFCVILDGRHKTYKATVTVVEAKAAEEKR